MIPFWHESTTGYTDLSASVNDPWCTVKFAGNRVPGICKVTGDGLQFDLQWKKAKGASNYSVAWNGEKPSKINIDVSIYTPTQWENFQKLLVDVVPKGTKQPPPLAVEHPALLAIGITQIIVESVSPPQVDADGVGHIQISVSKWFPQQKKISGKAAAKPPEKKREPYDYVTPRDFLGRRPEDIKDNPYAQNP